jgi:hypothetical protein
MFVHSRSAHLKWFSDESAGELARHGDCGRGMMLRHYRKAVGAMQKYFKA